MPVIFDKASIRCWPAEIRLWLNGCGAELLRAAGENRVRLRLVSRRIDTPGDGDDDPTLVDEDGARWVLGPTPAVAGREAYFRVSAGTGRGRGTDILETVRRSIC